MSAASPWCAGSLERTAERQPRGMGGFVCKLQAHNTNLIFLLRSREVDMNV